MQDALLHLWQSSSSVELVSVAFGLFYVVLAARAHIACWPMALVNTSTAIYLLWSVNLYMDAGLNVFYFAMAIYGWSHWQKSQDQQPSTTIHRWGLHQHTITIAVGIVLSLVSGFLLDSYSDAAFPYLDSATTWFALIATWMLARKVLENWLYWIVIDVISIGLYLQKGLHFYSLLFVIYCVVAIYGYWFWKKQSRKSKGDMLAR